MKAPQSEPLRSQLCGGPIRLMHIRPRSDEMHRHVFFELVYVVRGSATHYLGSETMQLQAGDYFVIDTGSSHCYRDIRDFEIVNCLFLPEYIDRALIDCPTLAALLSNRVMRFGVPVDIRAADRIFQDTDGSMGRLIRLMEQEHEHRRTGYMELLRCYLTQALVHIVRASEEAEQTRSAHAATVTAAEYLRAHYSQPLSLEALSALVSYTPQYLSSTFRKDTGMSIQTFLQRLRVEEACRLMGQTSLSLSAIAQQVGYSDAKHFAKLFRKYKGISPREFRINLASPV